MTYLGNLSSIFENYYKLLLIIINLFVFASWSYAESTTTRNIFKRTLGLSPKVLKLQRTRVLLVFWWIKIENRDVAIHTQLNFFQEETFVTDNVVRKKNWPFLNIRETEILAFWHIVYINTYQITHETNRAI